MSTVASTLRLPVRPSQFGLLVDLSTILLLVGAGLAAGYVAGLVGVGGGIVFAPVLFFYFESTGVPPGVLTPLTVGSSLFCTLLAALASTRYQLRRGAVLRRVALWVGLFSAAAVFVTARYVTTQPWYDEAAFQVAFSTVLLVVVARMLLARRSTGRKAPERAVTDRQTSKPVLALTGSAAGAVSAAVGVGGGVVLVPAYNRFLGVPIHHAVGTSSATIVLISFVGVVTYGAAGLGADVPATALGYVDAGRALLLAAPAVLSARAGVWTAHRIDRRPLQWAFAAVALVVAARLLVRAL